MKPIESAAKALCDWQEPKTCETTCDYCQMQVRAAVLAYLRALAEQGFSKNTINQISVSFGDQKLVGFEKQNLLTAAIRAHIAELEASHDT